MMLKPLVLLLLPLFLISETTMKCAPGKCASAATAMTKEIPKKEMDTSQMKCAPGKCASAAPAMTKEIPKKEMDTSQMKCAPGKCASADTNQLKNIPKKDETSSSMKCAPGKCAQGSSNSLKDLPQKTQLSKNRPTIKQLFNVKTIQAQEIRGSKKQVNYGYITAQDSRKVDVYAWYSGFVDTLYADTLYKKVNKGDLLAKVYSPEVFQAKQDYLNSINYNIENDAPAMLQSAMTKLSLLGVSQKEIQEIQKKRTVSEYTMIYAPISGWVFEKNIKQGSSFNSSKKLFEIVNLDEVWVEVKLFQNELNKLDTLKNFQVFPKGTKVVYNAYKSLLYPIMNPKESTATLRLIVQNNTAFLKPGMYVKVHASSKDSTRLVIPRTAAIRKNGLWYAFLATEFKGEYEPIQIKILPLDNKHYEVIEGLNVSDTVVNNALFMMDSDAQINGIY